MDIITFKVYIPSELINAFTQWANDQGYGVNATGAVLEGETFSSHPTLHVWKRNDGA